MVLQVGAQSTDTNLEELLKLAKEKLQQVKPDYTNSNITLNQFSKHLSKMTLSQEQITEIEKDRSAIFLACIERITIQKEQPGGLCDAFADYLMEKCKRFDNLLAYCTGQEVLPAIYGSKRL